MIHEHPDFVGVRFRIDGGDGDQSLFGSYLLLERVSAPWFNDDAAKRRNSWLMQVVGGRHDRLLFTISPRTLGTIEAAIATDGWKSVVVNGLPDRPNCNLSLYPEDAKGGMTFVERI